MSRIYSLRKRSWRSNRSHIALSGAQLTLYSRPNKQIATMLKLMGLRKATLILIALVGSAWSIRSADTIPQVPGPPAFIDGAAPSDKLRAIGLVGKPESATLL